MYNKKSIFTFLLSILLMLPFSIILSACGEQPSATGVSVFFNNEDITENGKTLYVEYNDQLNLADCVRVELNYDNGGSEVLSLKTESSNGYFITSNIPETMIAGETYTYTISYGNYPDVVITIVVDKAQNTIELSKNLNKVYDKNKVTLSAADYSMQFDMTPTIKWYSLDGTTETELQEAPAVVGEYKVVISVPETENYRATSYEENFTISQATPNYKIPSFTSVLYSDTIDRLSDILLPTGFVWQADQELEVGTNLYKVTYTPTDTKNYRVVSDISVQISYKQLIEKPQIVGEYFYNPNGEVAVEYSSFDEDAITLAKNSDTEVQTQSGTYKVRLKLIDTTKYVWSDKTTDNLELTWVIKKLLPTYIVPEIEDQHFTNDTTSQYYDSRVSTLAEISLPEGFSWVNPSQTLAVGSHNYIAKFESVDENYDTVDSINIAIEYYMYLAKPTFETITYSKIDGGMTPNISNFDDNYMTIVSVDNGSNLKQDNAGIYYYQVTIKDASNSYIRWADNSAALRSISWIINKQTVTAPSIKNNNIDYTGESFDVIWDNELVLNDDLPYVLSDASDDITQTNVGTYKYYFTLKDPINYKWDTNAKDATIELVWTINPIDINVGDLEDVVLNGVYSPTQTLADIDLPQFYTWKNPETIPTCDVITYVAIYNLDRNNYRDVEVVVTLNLSKANPTYNVPTFANIYYSDVVNDLTDITLQTGFEWQAEQELVLGSSSYKATFTPDDVVNYQTIEDIAIEITYKALVLKPSIKGTYSYNPSESVTVQFDNFNDLTMALANDSDNITQANSGTYTIILKLIDTSKYVWEDKTTNNIELTWVISKLPSNVDTPFIADQHFTNDSSSQYFATSVETLADITLPDGFSWINPETTLVIGDHKYMAKYNPTNTNYESIDSVELSIKYYLYLATPSIETIDYSSSETGLIPNIFNFNDAYMTIVSVENGNVLTQNNAGTHNYTVSIDNEYVYWSDGTNTDKVITWTINPINPTVDRITIDTQYSNEITTLSQINLEEGFSWKDGSTTLSAGTHSYAVVFTPEDNVNFNSVEFSIDIRYIVIVNIPVLTNINNYYTGEAISPVWQNTLTNCYIKGVNGDSIENYSQTNIGEYTITVALVDENYMWSDGSTEDIEYTFVIEAMPSAVESIAFDFYDKNNLKVSSTSEQPNLLTQVSDSEYVYSGGIITGFDITLRDSFTYKIFRDSTEISSFENLNNYGDFKIEVYNSERNLVDLINITIANKDICGLVGITANKYISDATSAQYQKLYIYTNEPSLNYNFTSRSNVSVNCDSIINSAQPGISYIPVQITMTVDSIDYIFDTNLILNYGPKFSELSSTGLSFIDEVEEFTVSDNHILDLTPEEIDTFVNSDTKIKCTPKDYIEVDIAEFDTTTTPGLTYIHIRFIDSSYVTTTKDVYILIQ